MKNNPLYSFNYQYLRLLIHEPKTLTDTIKPTIFLKILVSPTGCIFHKPIILQ